MKEPDFKVIIELEYKVVVGKLVENETESTKCLPEKKMSRCEQLKISFRKQKVGSSIFPGKCPIAFFHGETQQVVVGICFLAALLVILFSYIFSILLATFEKGQIFNFCCWCCLTS